MSSCRNRLFIVAIALCTLFSLLILRFYFVQVVEEEKWKKQARIQHQFAITEPYKRGVFYSNTAIKPGHPEGLVPLVVDVPKFHLYIDPMMLPEEHKPLIQKKIVEFLQLTDSKRLESHFVKKSRSRRLKSWLSREERQRLQTWWDPFAKKNKIAKNALFFVQDFKRSYPFGHLLGQVLHTIREDGSTPTGGLEMHFDHLLKGVEGKRILERSPRFSLDSQEILSPPKNGADIHLTINHYLQAIVEEELEKGVSKLGAKGGFALMMNPENGEVLALGQYPFFDPAHYRDYYNEKSRIQDTRMKVAQDIFEPGSIIKPITLAIALKANEVLHASKYPPLFDPEEMLPTSDGSLPGRRAMRDVRLHQFLNMDMALQKSSNIYMSKLVKRVVDQFGSKWYRDQLSCFGFGEKSGVELPSENPGMLPVPGRLHPNGTLEWSTPTPFSLAIGYNLMVNALQATRAIAVFANGGYLVRPTILRKVTRGNEVLHQSLSKRKRILSKTIADRVAKAMKFVTKKGGPAAHIDIYGYTEAGKTSTSEKLIGGSYSKTQHFSTFVGFSPAKGAKLVLFVGVDEPPKRYIQGFGHTHFGSKSAGPIFREIAKRSLDYMGVEKDDPFGYPRSDPRFNEERADWYKEANSLIELYEKWN